MNPVAAQVEQLDVLTRQGRIHRLSGSKCLVGVPVRAVRKVRFHSGRVAVSYVVGREPHHHPIGQKRYHVPLVEIDRE